MTAGKEKEKVEDVEMKDAEEEKVDGQPLHVPSYGIWNF